MKHLSLSIPCRLCHLEYRNECMQDKHSNKNETYGHGEAGKGSEKSRGGRRCEAEQADNGKGKRKLIPSA